MQTLPGNLTFNFTVAQTLDFDEDSPACCLPGRARLRLAYRGWGGTTLHITSTARAPGVS
jgi:hypothetical protein